MQTSVRILLRFALLTASLVAGLAASQASQATTAVLSDGRIIDWSTAGSQVWLMSADGSRSPLWNGIHSLRDGGQLTIRNGVLASRPWSAQGALPQDGLCQQLVKRVCGDDGDCSDTTACKLARQMEAMDRRSGSPASAPGSEPQCAVALRDPAFFRVCR